MVSKAAQKNISKYNPGSPDTRDTTITKQGITQPCVYLMLHAMYQCLSRSSMKEHHHAGKNV